MYSITVKKLYTKNCILKLGMELYVYAKFYLHVLDVKPCPIENSISLNTSLIVYKTV